MEGSWGEALGCELQDCQQLFEEISEAEILRTPSTADGLSSSESSPEGMVNPPSPGLSSNTWWGRVLAHAAQDAGIMGSSSMQSKRLNVVSCCAGSCSENFVLKALNMEFDIVSMSEANQECRRLCMANTNPEHVKHMFGSIEDQCRAHSPCLLCHERGQQCNVRELCESEGVDLLVAGSPCDPFSKMRAKRFACGTLKQHVSYGITMDAMVESFLCHKPKVAIMEQVAGFTMTSGAGSSDTPFSRFMAAFSDAQTRAAEPGYFVAKFMLDATLWVKISRLRCYLVFFRKNVFDREHVSMYKRSVEALLEAVGKRHTPRLLTSFLLQESSPLYKEQEASLLSENYVGCQVKIRRSAESRSLWQQWQVQACRIRQQFKVSSLCKPWTSMECLNFRNIAPNKRIGELLDLAVIRYVGPQKACTLGSTELRQACAELFTDTSQNPARFPHTSDEGLARCLTSSSIVYSYHADRLVLPLEHMLWQGHEMEVKIPEGMSQKNLRDVAGQGMHLPCLACLVAVLQYTGNFESQMGV